MTAYLWAPLFAVVVIATLALVLSERAAKRERERAAWDRQQRIIRDAMHEHHQARRERRQWAARPSDGSIHAKAAQAVRSDGDLRFHD